MCLFTPYSSIYRDENPCLQSVDVPFHVSSGSTNLLLYLSSMATTSPDTRPLVRVTHLQRQLSPTLNSVDLSSNAVAAAGGQKKICVFLKMPLNARKPHQKWFTCSHHSRAGWTWTARICGCSKRPVAVDEERNPSAIDTFVFFFVLMWTHIEFHHLCVSLCRLCRLLTGVAERAPFWFVSRNTETRSGRWSLCRYCVVVLLIAKSVEGTEKKRGFHQPLGPLPTAGWPTYQWYIYI